MGTEIDCFGSSKNRVKTKPIYGIRELILHGSPQATDAGLLSCVTSLLSLRRLDIDGLDAEKSFRSLDSLTQLEHLSLSGCNPVNDVVASRISTLPHLVHLELPRCTYVLDACVFQLVSLRQLRVLDLSHTQVTNSGLAHMSAFCELRRLILRSCKKVSDEGIPQLAPLEHLEELNLSGCALITNDGVKWFAVKKDLAGQCCEWSQLRILDLSDCKQITDASLQDIASLGDLQQLNLSGCPEISDDGLAHLLPLVHLRVLRLKHCTKIRDRGLECMSLARLSCLDLRECDQITDVGIRKLAAASQHLEELDVGACWRLTDEAVLALLSMPRLRLLNLNLCSVTDESAQLLALFPQLRQVSLIGCPRITETSLADLRSVAPFDLITKE